MTKSEILDYFKDINLAYNDCTRLDTLSSMLDELLKEQPKIVRCKDCKYAKMTIDGDLCKYCELDEDEDGFLREVYRDAEWFCADGESR